jgi:tetratricopeptide (TPR) repeat protein
LLEQAFAVEPMNGATAFAIGEIYRLQSAEGNDGYRQLTARAMDWFARARKLNPWDGGCDLSYGWCLDWLERSDESWPYFDRAEQLDPNNYYTLAYIGLHYMNRGDYAAARPWMERSLDLAKNVQVKTSLLDAAFYLDLINRKLLAAATNDLPATLYLPKTDAGSPTAAKPLKH